MLIHPGKLPLLLRRKPTESQRDGISRHHPEITKATDWVSSAVYPQKCDGDVRVCIDPRHLNTALKHPHHKTPTLDEIPHHFQGANVFSKLDAKSSYWPVLLDVESQQLTTFHTPFGRYCYVRLPFGLSVSQDIFQKKMDHILAQVDRPIGICDDIATGAENDEAHDRILHNLMKVTGEDWLMCSTRKNAK